jgi:hypothetical protein
MLRLMEYGLLAVSLLVVVGLVLMTPRTPEVKPAENGEAEKGKAGKG